MFYSQKHKQKIFQRQIDLLYAQMIVFARKEGDEHILRDVLDLKGAHPTQISKMYTRIMMGEPDDK
jgi:hypothetical protein